MQKEEKFFISVGIILLLIPIWGTCLNFLGGYLRSPYPSAIPEETKKRIPLDYDEIIYERYLKNKET